jgi:hypothetical protein
VHSALSRPKSLAQGQCDLTDKSKAGDWRLPTIEELTAVYAYKGQFKGVKSGNYWSSSTDTSYTSAAWYVYMGSGRVAKEVKDNQFFVWPVRAGQ